MDAWRLDGSIRSKLLLEENDRESLPFGVCVIQKLTMCLYPVTRTLHSYEENWHFDGLVVDTLHRDWDYV